MFTSENKLSVIQKDVNELLSQSPDNEHTVAEYQKIYKRIRNHHHPDLVQYAIDKTLERNSFYRYKAAYQLCLAKEIDLQIRSFYENQDKSLLDEIIQNHIELKRIAPSIVNPNESPNVLSWKNNLSLYPADEIAHERKRKKIKHRRKGKKHSIKDLPEGWQINVFKALDKIDRAPFAVTALTGCRPSELENSVLISLDKDTGFITFEIKGAKFSDSKKKGQKIRWLTFDPCKNPLAKGLHQAMLNEDIGVGTIQIRTKIGSRGKKVVGELTPEKRIRQFSDRVRYAMQQKLGYTNISPYSVRHQAASDFKKSFDREKDIAVALGHRSARMKDHYGSPLYNKGCHGIVSVGGTHADLVNSHDYELTRRGFERFIQKKIKTKGPTDLILKPEKPAKRIS